MVDQQRSAGLLLLLLVSLTRVARSSALSPAPPAIASAAGSRITVPFGGGWRFHLGDNQHSPGSGPGTLGDFIPVPNASCTNMERNPNMRRGHLRNHSLGNCAVSCAYNPACYVHQLAFTIPNAHWQQCLHGGETTVCTANAHPSPHASGESYRTPAYVRTKVSPPRVDYSFAAPSYDDKSWRAISVPHDALINQTFDPSEDCTYSFLPRRVSWYRKRFALPPQLSPAVPAAGGQLYLRFDGVFHHAQIFLNGELIASHAAGYLPFTVRLDNTSSLRRQGTNTLAVRADATFGSGHWYEGGGIYRPVVLVLVPPRHFVEGGLFADPNSDGTTVAVSIELEPPTSTPRASASTHASFFLLASPTRVSLRLIDPATERVVAHVETTLTGTVGSAVLKPRTPLQRWGPASPMTYILAATTSTGDAVNFTFAARRFDWQSSPGDAVLNGEVVEMTGFSHHNSFAGLGVLQPARLSLFSAQLSRALGANSWRMSHNPYDNTLYEVLTELGIMVWDEARDYSPEYISDWREQVKLHRRHPSIIIWSYCNEEECCQLNVDSAGQGFHRVVHDLDQSRPTSGNYKIWECGTTNASQKPFAHWEPFLHSEIIGQSHAYNDTFDAIHKAYPSYPMILSESGGCGKTRSQRTPASCEVHDNEVTGLPYVMGSVGVWAMMDYFGEACHGDGPANTSDPGPYSVWPTVFGTFGNVDIAGYPKPSAWWYRVNWLANTPTDAPGRPLVGGSGSNVTVRALTVCEGFASTPWVELVVDGVRIGLSRPGAQTGGIVSFANESWCGNAVHNNSRPYHNVTLRGLAGDRSTELARHTMLAPREAARLELVVDVPSPTTGTGSALFLDGLDVALVRVQLVDEHGVVVTNDDRNVSFSIVSGPIRIAGVGSGENTNRQNVQGTRYQTYRGLGRVLLQPTVDCTSSGRMLAHAVDIDRDPAVLTFAEHCPTEAAVVAAEVHGLPAVHIRIPTSGDPMDHPIAVARANRALDTFTYLIDVQA